MPWYVLIFFALALLLSLAAWRWGGWPEQAAAAINLAATLAMRAIHPVKTVGYRHLEMTVLALDTIVLIAFLWVALRSDRWWPMLLPALLAPSFLAHLGRVIDPNVLASGYSMAGLTTYPIPLVIAVGIYRTARRRRALVISKTY